VSVSTGDRWHIVKKKNSK